MQPSVRHFVRKILGIHLLLLALLLAVVTMAARHVYQSARAQATEQAQARQNLMLKDAQDRQSLLASQTAKGVDGFYRSILSDLSLLKPDDEESSDLPDVVQVARRPSPATERGRRP